MNRRAVAGPGLDRGPNGIPQARRLFHGVARAECPRKTETNLPCGRDHRREHKRGGKAVAGFHFWMAREEDRNGRDLGRRGPVVEKPPVEHERAVGRWRLERLQVVGPLPARRLTA